MTFLLTLLVKALLWLRYRVRVRGLREVAGRGRRGVLFLPNHPALVDPVIVMAALRRKFAPRALADAHQVDRFFIRTLAKKAGVLPIPDIGKGGIEGSAAVALAIDEIVAALSRGENFLLYPAGRVDRGRLEQLGASSAVETILRRLPEVRVVLVRTRGLWGSEFSWAGGPPDVARAVKRAFWQLPAGLFLFAPRRRVEIELVESADLPRAAERATLNRWLERFYNQDAPPRTYVPYTPWERLRRAWHDRSGHETVQIPSEGEEEPEQGQDGPATHGQDAHATMKAPSGTREIVTRKLAEMSGAKSIRDEDRLANDLGMDSLAIAELAAWLEGEFGLPSPAPESLATVADVLLSACGELSRSGGGDVSIAASIRLRFGAVGGEGPGDRISIPAGDTIGRVFLEQARRAPARSLYADEASGLRTFRDVVTACLVLQERFAALEGEGLGIMLPASVGAGVTYLATLFAGKTPVLANWTLGERNLRHTMDLAGVRRIVTSARVLKRLEASGATFASLRERFLPLEEIGKGVGRLAKLRAASAARLSKVWSRLERARLSPTAAILFTSGSESLPKAVPLSHANLLANIRSVTDAVFIGRRDRLLGLLPPFHSFGLTVTTVLPACSGVPVVYHPNPTEGRALARLAGACGVTLLLGAPTFLGGIVRAAREGELAALRLIVTGAEKCPPHVYKELARKCPRAEVLEGYGMTECSPIISVNRPGEARAETIGRVLPSFEYALVDVETGARVGGARDAAAPATAAGAGSAEPQAAGGTQAVAKGVLLVRGPSVFGGYLSGEGSSPASPFVELDGKKWLRTGDLVVEEADGILRFAGRLKRFVKIGGEMISLPAIEEVIERRWPPREPAPGKPPEPVIAVEAIGEKETEKGTGSIRRTEPVPLSEAEEMGTGTVFRRQKTEPVPISSVPISREELVLFVAAGVQPPIDREAANRLLREAGLSPLHNLRRVIVIEKIPLLGTGKTDYRALKQTVPGK